MFFFNNELLALLGFQEIPSSNLKLYRQNTVSKCILQDCRCLNFNILIHINYFNK